MNDHWQLIALDPVGDVQMLFEDERAVSGQPSVGRIQGVTILGRHFSVAHIYLWERLPEKIYTASLGEWSLSRRYVDDAAGLTAESLPHYEQRHHHLHRNGRLDVTGYSPHDTLAQSSRMQQFGPYGELVAEGTISPEGEAVIDAANLATQSGPERRRVMALGLTGKQYDPDSKLYYFGYRWYSPELMRWTQMEPLGLDGPNLWHFTHGNPIGRYDWSGLDDNVAISPDYKRFLGSDKSMFDLGSDPMGLRNDPLGLQDLQIDWDASKKLNEIGEGLFTLADHWGEATYMTMHWSNASEEGYQGWSNSFLDLVCFGALTDYTDPPNWNQQFGGYMGDISAAASFSALVPTAPGIGGARSFELVMPYTPMTVTSWAPAGVTPTLIGGRWVMMGGPTMGNWFATGQAGWWASAYPRANFITGTVAAGNLGRPLGWWEWLKPGQRIIVR